MIEVVLRPIGRDAFSELESALALVKPNVVVRGVSSNDDTTMYTVITDGVPVKFEGMWKSTIPFKSPKEMDEVVEAIEFANPCAIVARKNGYVLVFCDTTAC